MAKAVDASKKPGSEKMGNVRDPEPQTFKRLPPKKFTSVLQSQNLSKHKGESVPGAEKCNQSKIVEYQTRSKEGPVQRTKEFGHGKNVKDHTRSKEEPVSRTEEFGHRVLTRLNTVKVSGIFTV